MKWLRKSAGHLESDTGRFAIAETQGAEGVVHELWDLTAMPQRRLAAYPSAAEAKEAAELEDVF